MVALKCFKYFRKQYFVFLFFLSFMFLYLAEYIHIFVNDVTHVYPYSYVEKENTYKIENIVKYQPQEDSGKINISDFVNEINKYGNYESIKAYSTAIEVEGNAIFPETGEFFGKCYYITPDSDEVISLRYVYGGWFNKESEESQVILGNQWAEYYDAGDTITIYFGFNHEFKKEFKIAGILDYNSNPEYSGSYRIGFGYTETGIYEDSIYFNSLDFLEELHYEMIYDAFIIDTDYIKNMLVITDNVDELKKDFEGYDVMPISYFYENNFKYLVSNSWASELIIYMLLFTFGIIAVTYTVSRKLNLFFYVFSANGLSRKRYIFINSVETLAVIIISTIPAFVNEIVRYRLFFENTAFRIIMMLVMAVVSEVIFIVMYIVVSRKKLQVLYRESLEN